MKSKMKKSLFVTLIICVLLAVSALSVQAAGKTGWVRKGTTYKYKVNNTYVEGCPQNRLGEVQEGQILF